MKSSHLVTVLCTFSLVMLTSQAFAQTSEELNAVIKPHVFGQKGMSIFDDSIHAYECKSGRVCIGAVEGIYIIHQKDKKTREVYVVDYDELYSRNLHEQYGDDVVVKLIKLHLKTTRAKIATVPCHIARVYSSLVWSKPEKSFAVKALKHRPKKKVKPSQVKESSPLEANESFTSLYAKVHEKPAHESVTFFKPEELRAMQDPSMKQPRLRVKEAFVLLGQGKSGSSERRLGVMVALWSDESNRVYHYSTWDWAKANWGGERTSDEKKLIRTIDEAIVKGALATIEKSGVEQITVDLETACAMPKLFNLDEDNLVVDF